VIDAGRDTRRPTADMAALYGERCRPDARLIRGETIQRKNFFAKTS